jgi:molybdopterin adenylyltransferase
MRASEQTLTAFSSTLKGSGSATIQNADHEEEKQALNDLSCRHPAIAPHLQPKGARAGDRSDQSMIRAAIITLSDKGSKGEREDKSGPIIRDMIKQIDAVVDHYEVLPDEKPVLEEVLCRLSDSGTIDLILTTGGTGVAPRDVTPEATLEVIDRNLPGMAEAMRAESIKKTPHAMISRAVVGIRKQTLIVNLPGSPRAVRENLAVILSAIPHAIEKINGDPRECGNA